MTKPRVVTPKRGPIGGTKRECVQLAASAV